MRFFYYIAKYKFLVGFFLFLALALLFERNIRFQPNENNEFKRVQEILKRKTQKVDEILNNIEIELGSLALEDLMREQSLISKNLYDEEGIVFLGYSEDTLVFWTDNTIPVVNNHVENQLYNDIAKLKNGWFIIRHNYIDNYQLFGLILLKNEYSYQNEFIKSDFFHEYEIDVPVSIAFDKTKGFNIADHENNYLFSFEFKSNLIYNHSKVIVSSLFYFIAIILLFFTLKKLVSDIGTLKLRNAVLFFLAFFLLLLRYLMLEYHFPAVFKQLELFQPHHYAISMMVPSLGDLFLHAIFMFFFFTVFYTEFKITIPRKNLFKYLVVGLLITSSFALFGYINYFFESLIQHSSISFNVYQFFNLSIYSIVGFIIIVLYLATLFLFIDRILKIIKDDFQYKKFIQLFIILFIILVALFSIFSSQSKLIPISFFGILFLYLSYIRFYKKTFSYVILIIILVILALYTVVFITVTGDKKDKETRKVLALNLANEHDQIAEMLLEGIEEEIERDSVVKDLLTWPEQNEGAIREYLQMTYFSGYFRKYELDISFCNPKDDLTINLENSTEIVHCYTFFSDLFENDGTQLQNSRFYFLDNIGGSIRYLGQFVYKNPEWENEVSLFIYIDAKLISQELGYPELLLDSRMNRSTILSDYSYSKYKDGNLMTQSGEFSYQLTFPEDWQSGEEFYFTSDQKFEHLIYKIDDSTTVVISNNKLRFIDILASFSYIFVFYYILYTIVMFVLNFPYNIKEFNYDFKNKIKFSMIGVLLLSLIIVGFGTIYYNINQFERNLYERIGEKIQSVKVEMEHKLGGDFELSSEDYDFLTYLLIKFSSVFYIDINLYDVHGNLLASSQSQVFEKGLMGNKMDLDAYQQMVLNKSGKFIHKESIGELSYYSAYVPFTNDDNELLAYLNLPYFTKQSELRKEIYTIVVAVVNIYFFLILLSVIVAIFISNNITKPLVLIQERFRAIDLGKQNEPIAYNSHDEIGSLIKEYNRMVSELTDNAEKLAKSERESAWREMAKQIAHEIKNPLTPMKLSVQYLQKAWKDEIPDFDKRLEKFSNSLISQINNLSSIATEFSNFAKMPRARAEEVNIIAKLADTINLFESTENVKFDTDFNNIQELYVYADKEQLLIVFSNLIKNGIQAVPRGRDALIKIRVEIVNEKVKISISDNGTGISEDLKDKLFIPNFTTKTSGMGLGLAIVRNIVVSADGEIWYETKTENLSIGELGSTTFFVTFPIYKQYE
ncbi:ATP-binding protein [Bacteroidota bacterium]